MSSRPYQCAIRQCAILPPHPFSAFAGFALHPTDLARWSQAYHSLVSIFTVPIRLRSCSLFGNPPPRCWFFVFSSLCQAGAVCTLARRGSTFTLLFACDRRSCFPHFCICHVREHFAMRRSARLSWRAQTASIISATGHVHVELTKFPELGQIHERKRQAHACGDAQVWALRHCRPSGMAQRGVVHVLARAKQRGSSLLPATCTAHGPPTPPTPSQSLRSRCSPVRSCLRTK